MNRGQTQPAVVQQVAKEFAKFLNRVQDSGHDILGSFLIENEWEKYVDDAADVMRSLELGGFVVAPRELTDAMVASADETLSKARSLMGARGLRIYMTAVYRAMIAAWVDNRDLQLALDIVSMALSRASSSGRREGGPQDSSYRRFTKSSQEILADIERSGFLLLPEEPTAQMISAGVAETAENRASARVIGADPNYVKQIYQNLVAARPDDCRVV